MKALPPQPVCLREGFPPRPHGTGFFLFLFPLMATTDIELVLQSLVDSGFAEVFAFGGFLLASVTFSFTPPGVTSVLCALRVSGGLLLLLASILGEYDASDRYLEC